MYGQVTKSLGNGFFEIMCFSDKGNVIKRAHIRGKMRRRVWMIVGDVILVNHRGFQEGTCDIVHKYSSHDVRILRSQKHLPAQININEEEEPTADDAFVFNNSDDEEESVPDQQRNFDLPSSESDEER